MTVLRIIVCTVLLHMAFSCLRLIASLDVLAHGATSFQTGVVVSLLAVGPTFAAVYCGRWIDRVGAKIPELTGAACIATACSIAFFFPITNETYVSLYIACLIGGMGFMCIMMVSQQMVGMISTAKTRQTNFSWLAMGLSASGLVSPILAGTIIDQMGFQASFAAAIGLAALGTALFLLSMGKLPAAPVKSRVAKSKDGMFSLLRIPGVRHVLMVSALVSMAWDLQHFMFPVYGHAIGLSASEIGWLVGIFFSATFLVRFLLPLMAKYFTEWQFLTLTLFVGGLGYALFPFFDTFGTLAPVAFLLGLGLGASQPNVMTLLHTQSPQGRVGEAIGIRTMFTNGCHAILPTFFGALTAAVGVVSIFAAMTVLMTGSALASLQKYGRLGKTSS